MKTLMHAFGSAYVSDGLQDAPDTSARGHLKDAHELRTISKAGRHFHGLNRQQLGQRALRVHLHQRPRRQCRLAACGVRQNAPVCGAAANRRFAHAVKWLSQAPICAYRADPFLCKADPIMPQIAVDVIVPDFR
jgi:hypothetical protein